MPPKKKASATAAAPEVDVSMADASPPAGVPEPEYDMTPDDQRIRIVSYIVRGWYWIYVNHIFQLPGASDTAASFEFKKEDHTLGNALRYIIMKKSACPAPRMPLPIAFAPDLSIL